VSAGARRVAVLGWHKIGAPPAGGWDTWYYVPEATFAAQLGWLRDAGWQVLEAEALLRGLDAPGTLPERSALLTFDDGCRSMLDAALPPLQRFGFPSVLFVPTDWVGRTNHFDRGVEPEEPICTWDELRRLRRLGVAVESHGASHRAFSRLSPDERRDELTRSKRALEEGVGAPVSLFAFPYGDPGPDAAATAALLAGAGYRAAFRYPGGPLRLPDAPRFALARVAMGPDTDLARELEDG